MSGTRDRYRRTYYRSNNRFGYAARPSGPNYDNFLRRLITNGPSYRPNRSDHHLLRLMELFDDLRRPYGPYLMPPLRYNRARVRYRGVYYYPRRVPWPNFHQEYGYQYSGPYGFLLRRRASVLRKRMAGGTPSFRDFGFPRTASGSAADPPVDPFMAERQRRRDRVHKRTRDSDYLITLPDSGGVDEVVEVPSGPPLPALDTQPGYVPSVTDALSSLGYNAALSAAPYVAGVGLAGATAAYQAGRNIIRFRAPRPSGLTDAGRDFVLDALSRRNAEYNV